MEIQNNLPTQNPAGGIRLGLIRAVGLNADAHLPELDDALTRLVQDATARSGQEGERHEARRRAVRDMLRNGRYKPTGRGKPSWEYLARAAAENSFPRINTLVDINNLISLAHGLPISIWDLEAMSADSMVFRLGREDEEYAFNPSGQVLRLHDLAIGCVRAEDDEGEGVPIVSPIKDSQATKTHDGTASCGVAIYAPTNSVGEEDLLRVCGEFEHWLRRLGDSVDVRSKVVNAGEAASL